MIKFFISKACYLSPWGWENNGMTIRTMLVPTQCPRDKLYSWVYCTLVHRVQDSRGWVSSTRWSSMTLCQWGINNNKIWVSANWSIVLTPSLQAINRRRPKVWTFCSDLVTDCEVMWVRLSEVRGQESHEIRIVVWKDRSEKKWRKRREDNLSYVQNPAMYTLSKLITC